MLNPPGAVPYDPDSFRGAKFVPITAIPQPAAYGCVAVFRMSLAKRLAELGATCGREYDKLQGGWYQISGIELPSGRFAYVQEFEHHPGDVNLSLPIWRDVHLHRQDFFGARALLSVHDEQVLLCDGPYLWR